MTKTQSGPLDIVVLAGGISHERDISLRSGRRVQDALVRAGHNVTMSEPDSELLAALGARRPQVIWPALHGASGEDGALRGLLSGIGIPYVGSLAGPSRLAWHKPTAKEIVSRAGVATAESLTITREAFRELGASSVLEAIETHMGVPLVVKPSEGGSAQGVSLVDDVEALPRAMVEAYTYSDVALIERRLHGTEIAIAIIDLGDGPQVLPAVEIEPLSGVYSFEARYNAGETLFYTPARLDAEVTQRATNAALAAYEALGLRHISRVDMIVTADGTPWFLEANVLPGLTETSLVPLAIEAAGLSQVEVYSGLARAAVAG